jgi:hypothetical protein
MVSSASAAKFPLSFNSSSTEGLSIVPGNDTLTSLCVAYPCASLEWRSKNDIEISLSLFRAQVSASQPQTYYTDLVRIENSGNTNQNVDSVFVRVTSGASFLGGLTVFYCSLPSRDPYGDSDCALSTVNDTVNSGHLLGNGILPASLGPGGIGYIGAAGFANAGAKVSEQISLQISISTSEPSA